MSTDIILPSLPLLTSVQGLAASETQAIIAFYVLGISAGLAIWPMLSSDDSAVSDLIACLAGFAAASFVATIAPPGWIVPARMVQGFFAAFPIILAPALISRISDNGLSNKAMALLSGLESLGPMIAPILGVALVSGFGWRSPFVVIAGLAFVILSFCKAQPLKGPKSAISAGRQASRKIHPCSFPPSYWVSACSHACAFASVLVFAFSLPVASQNIVGWAQADYVAVQVSGVLAFAVTAFGAAGLLQLRSERPLIWIGSTILVAGLIVLSFEAIRDQPHIVAITFAICNVGFGLRGPRGFLRTIRLSNRAETAASAILLALALGLSGAVVWAVSPTVVASLDLVMICCAFLGAASLAIEGLLVFVSRSEQ